VIFLSWIQNFFERFKKEEEAVRHEIHTNKSDIQPRIQHPSNKDLDARITYQYPKGHFRFPVIPDKEKKPVRREKELVEKKKQPKDQNHSQRDHQRQQQKVQKPTFKPKNDPIEKIHKGGPFRPTEIPSPVFGFSRPKATIVEYELSDFKIKSQKEDAPIIKNLKGYEELDKTVSIESEAAIQEREAAIQESEAAIQENESAIQEVEAAIQENESAIQENEAAIQENEAAIQENESAIQEVEAATQESEDAIQEKEEGIQKIEPAIKESEAVLADIGSNEELIESIIHNETNQNDSVLNKLLLRLESDEDDQDSKGLAEDLTDAKITEQVKTEAELTFVEVAAAVTTEHLSIENSETVEEIDEQIEPVDEIKNDDIELGTSEEENENPESPKRKHLPFNVMMLKQDRQRWEEKRQQKEKPSISRQETPSVIIKEAAPEMEPNLKESDTSTENGTYEFPAFELLNPPIVTEMDMDWLKEQENLLNQTLENFNVGAKVVNITQGPSVTRFEVHPEPGVKVNKVTNLTDDIKLSLAARDIRMEAPIPGKHTIGIEVPNQKSRPVQISEIIQSNVFHDSVSPLTAVLGLDISGKPIVTDLKKMPHGLIAGATGSGKSVCINTILVSLLYKASPEDLKLLLIDPKMVELAPYNRIPHLVSPVITDVKAATAALKWAVDEMERRYELFAHTGVRDINRFNELAIKHKRYSDKLPFIVIIIDELADLMMMSPADVEEAICRIAQKARACGIHLIIATQRPSVDVITGLIKANIPTRIAFSVSSQVDSRTIIDIGGAEKLLGRGDMLFLENGSSKPVRLQGTFVSDDEIDLVVAHVREQQDPDYLFEQEELLKKAQISEEEDELFYEACEFVVDQASASTSSLQRRFKIGYNRAARLMEMMEQHGYISSAKGSKPRDVLITEADLENIQETGF
jgi:S-DNA-T family DNA segregation ATPase FtsK/SpoIIIE